MSFSTYASLDPFDWLGHYAEEPSAEFGIRATNEFPAWIVLIEKLGPTSIAVAALLITTYFASRQWLTARDKLRFDLFEKRYEYFLVLRDFLRSVVSRANLDYDAMQIFDSGMVGHQFLFDKALIDRIENLRVTAIRVRANVDRLEGLDVGKERDEVVRKISEDMRVIRTALNALPELFASYMKFR